MTAQEKSARGLPLTAADIQELLKDPNSWVSKLYQECLAIAFISELAFIRYLETAMRDAALRAELKESAAHVKHDAADKDFSDVNAEALRLQQQNAANATTSTAANDAVVFTDIFLNMLEEQQATLLAVPQANMTTAQLITHHQNVTANFNNQIAAKLGPTITLPLGKGGQPVTLVVPQMASKPAASAHHILSKNPGLNTTVQADADIREGFIKHIALNVTGPHATIDQVKNILHANKALLREFGIELKHLTVTPSIMKFVDVSTESCRTDDLVKHLMENARHLIQQMPTLTVEPAMLERRLPSLAKPPAMFAPTPASRQIKEADEKTLLQRRKPI